MSFFRVTWFVGLASMIPALCAPARAADPIEFEFGGVFTQVSGATVHTVGSSFAATVRFDAASVDLNPSTLIGTYRFASFTVPGRLGSQITLNDAFINIRVNSDAPHTWRIDFFGSGAFAYSIVLNFPTGYFPNDSLPVTLDFPQASTRLFQGFDSNFSLEGTVNSFAVVPEPAFGAASCLTLTLAMRRRRKLVSA